MKKKTVTIGDTTLHVTEENGVVTVHIDSEDVVVNMKGNVIWSVGNDKEEFKAIPTVMHAFFVEQGYYHLDTDPKTEMTTLETHVAGEEIAFYFEKNKKKPIIARVNFITTREEVMSLIQNWETENHQALLADKEGFDERLNLVNKAVKDAGYEFHFSHATDEWAYGWWDMAFDSTDWSEPKFLQVIKAVSFFNSYVRALHEKLEQTS